MRGGVQVWKRGVGGHGLRHATAYALQGGCDAAEVERKVSAGAEAAAEYGPEDAPSVTRWTVTDEGKRADRLDADKLRAWIDGADPETGEQRGRSLTSPDAHLLYDSTINAPKTYSLAAVLHPELREEYEALMDRVTDETVTAWQDELSTRRGAGGKQRIDVARIEVVQLDHERSRSLDPHAHRHLWLNAKVQGADGKWSNVDSQQVFRHQVLVNARGELAARTDSRWRAALASHGYTLDDSGEIAELAHVVDPMSKRAQQITRNKARFESEWRDAHPGQEPSPRLVESWDRRAWALDRAQKPDELDEEQWRDQVRREIADVDPAALDQRPAVPVVPGSAAELDPDQLTQRALGWVDQRAVRSQGRFSRVDLRAGATMALAQTQLITDPAEHARIIAEVETRALLHIESLAPSGVAGPDDVKTLRLTEVGETRARITERAAVRAAIGDPTPAPEESIAAALHTVDAERAATGERPVQLDARQIEAARAVAGSSPLVVIEGPAGAGKTTMLTVAERAVAADGHRMITVAPTMKAAQVASAEIGTDGSSLHGLLYQHGFRWHPDASGRTRWTRLREGEIDENGQPFYGPRADAHIAAGDVVVCDEAGMVDLDAMHALLTVADESGARLVLAGDPHQVRPVGHSGAMSLVQGETPDAASLSLEAIHRFRRADDPREADHAYAEITRDMRSAGTPEKAREVAHWLGEHDHLTRCTDSEDQLSHVTREWMTAHGRGESVAVMAGDNATVGALNESIQAARLDAGQLDTDRMTTGRSDQRFHVGDVVTTRRNSRGSDFTVANREVWKVVDVDDQGSLVITGGTDQRTETLPDSYVSEHVDLGYACTVHGAQGVTAQRGITVVSEETTAAQLYVGMTRGKTSNTAVVVAADDRGAAEVVGDAIMRDRNDLNDEQLRALVASDLDRAGANAPVDQHDGPAHWRDRDRRPFGDLVDPEPIHGRLSTRRARLTQQLRRLETQHTELARRLDVELRPAAATARRDGADPLEVATRERHRDAAQEKLAELDKQLTEDRKRLGTVDRQLDDLAGEIRHRLTLDPEAARREQHEREGAAIQQPARPTDTLRRPFGLARDLGRERRRVIAERNEATLTRDRAASQEEIAASRAADARTVEEEARRALHSSQEELASEHRTLTDQYAGEISRDLSAVRERQRMAESAGVLRRRAARRSADEAEARFTARWGELPPVAEEEAWARGRAAERAEDQLSSSPVHERAQAAQRAHEDAHRRREQADQAEQKLRETLEQSRRTLRDLEGQEGELRRESALRQAQPEEVAAKERRLRHARESARSSTPRSRQTGRPGRPSSPVDAETERQRRGPQR